MDTYAQHYHQDPPFRYLSGDLISMGDIVTVASETTGKVVLLAYEVQQFTELGLDDPGVMVDQEDAGLVYYTTIDEDLELKSRAPSSGLDIPF